MAGEIFFFSCLSLFFLASSCTLASKHPLLRYRLGVIASEQSGEAGVGEEGGGGPLSGRLARVITSQR